LPGSVACAWSRREARYDSSVGRNCECRADDTRRRRLRSAAILPLRLWRPDAFASRFAYEEFGFGVYYGIMLVMVLYNLSLFLFVRDRNYLYYVLYIGT
jgi:hypothetical protein